MPCWLAKVHLLGVVRQSVTGAAAVGIASKSVSSAVGSEDIGQLSLLMADCEDGA
jgi:hypothetical protein